jgi:NAD-dependent deacetylase sirtuin 5
VAPEDSHFTLITQNVDGMSKRALENLVVCDTSAQKNDGQPKMIEMHGRLFDLICSSDTCDYAEHNLDSPISAALAETEQLVAKGIMDPDIPHSDLPHCPKCNDLARPGVVWFGEMPHDQDVIDELVEKADLCLVVGTSSTVNPPVLYDATSDNSDHLYQ